VVPGEELPAPQLTPVPTAILARVVIPGKEERVGDLPTETAGYVDEPDEAYDEGTGDLDSFRSKSPGAIRLQELGLAVEDQPNRSPDGNNRQGLIGSVKCKAPHYDDSRLVPSVGSRLTLERPRLPVGTPRPMICSDNIWEIHPKQYSKETQVRYKRATGSLSTTTLTSRPRGRWLSK